MQMVKKFKVFFLPMSAELADGNTPYDREMSFRNILSSRVKPSEELLMLHNITGYQSIAMAYNKQEVLPSHKKPTRSNHGVVYRLDVLDLAVLLPKYNMKSTRSAICVDHKARFWRIVKPA